MDIEKVKQAQTQKEACQFAIEYQEWANQESLSMSELIEWQAVFIDLADKFDLAAEFIENGII